MTKTSDERLLKLVDEPDITEAIFYLKENQGNITQQGRNDAIKRLDEKYNGTDNQYARVLRTELLNEKERSTLFVTYVNTGDSAAALKLLIENGDDISYEAKGGVLITAATRGYEDIVTKLLDDHLIYIRYAAEAGNPAREMAAARGYTMIAAAINTCFRCKNTSPEIEHLTSQLILNKRENDGRGGIANAIKLTREKAATRIIEKRAAEAVVAVAR